MSEVGWLNPLRERVAKGIAAAMSEEAPAEVRWQDCLREADAAILATLEWFSNVSVSVDTLRAAGILHQHRVTATGEFRSIAGALAEELKGGSR